MMKRLLRALCLWLVLTLSACALAEPMLITTPGGPVKMRKKPDSKSSLVVKVPNHSMVEAEEAEDGWYHVTYKGKSGYVMGEYLEPVNRKADGPMTLTVSPEAPAVGCDMTFSIACEDAADYSFGVTRTGAKAVKDEKIPHGTVYYRPRKAGDYTLEASVTTTGGDTYSCRILFTVADADGTVDSRTEFDGLRVFSQRDGWWKDKKYRTSTLDEAGCAIFTLAHALDQLGLNTDPGSAEYLAKKYRYCLVDGGTLNATLIGHAAKEYGYTTKQDLINSKGQIADYLQEGAMFSFAVVKGHIALVCGLSDDGTKVKVVDSAPSVTKAKLGDEPMYRLGDAGWETIGDLADVPGTRYFMETGEFGGMWYYLTLDYAAKRGVRLIKPGK